MPIDMQNKIEGFSDANTGGLSYDILLRTLLFGMVFYVINNKLTEQLLSGFRSVFDIGLLQTILFCGVYILISISL
jgi:hypothetical protein